MHVHYDDQIQPEYGDNIRGTFEYKDAVAVIHAYVGNGTPGWILEHSGMLAILPSTSHKILSITAPFPTTSTASATTSPSTAARRTLSAMLLNGGD